MKLRWKKIIIGCATVLLLITPSVSHVLATVETPNNSAVTQEYNGKCVLGSVVGAGTGFLGGAAIGSVVPVIGTTAGALVGTVSGAATGAATTCFD